VPNNATNGLTTPSVKDVETRTYESNSRKPPDCANFVAATTRPTRLNSSFPAAAAVVTAIA